MAYASTSLATAAALLAARLSDPASRFYTAAEQSAAIREALRVWNVLTSHDRTVGFVSTTPATAFYDLPTALLGNPADPTTLLRPYTLTDADILAEIRFHLVEDVLPTDMFTTAQMVDALQRSRDQFLRDTAIVLTPRSDIIVGGGDGTFDFPDSVVAIRRASFRASDGRYIPLSRSDERTSTAFNRLWNSGGTPRAYSVTATPALRIRLIPPPAAGGALNTYVTSTGAAFSPTQAVSTLLGVPDDLVWAVKWGAISTLLASDGPGSDPERAARAAKLYALGVSIASRIPTILHASIDGAPVIPGSMASTDRFRAGWEGRTTARPTAVSTLGPDTIALTPVPDSAPHSIALDVVRNTLVPTAPTDFLQVGAESLDAILGYAHWLCVWKCGGEELTTADQFQSAFFEAAKRAAFQRSAASTALSSMLGTGTLDARAVPLEIDPSEGVRNADEIRQERNLRRRATTQ